MAKSYRYLIAGAGLAGVSAVRGIRERDKEGTIALAGLEGHMPYDRPPLTKKLWFGKKKIEDIFLGGQDFYDDNGVDLLLGVGIKSVDATAKKALANNGLSYGFEKLLIATGGSPRRLNIPGGDLPEIFYYRTLDDYVRLRALAKPGKSVLIIGGGFIGSELAAALNVNMVEVTMVFPDSYLVSKVFPEGLGRAIQGRYIKKGVGIITGERPVSIIKTSSARFSTTLSGGRVLESDIVVAGLGIAPSVELAQGAGLKTGNGIIVDETLRTTHPDIYAAGDNAFFPYKALGQGTRVEHWDNALNQGRFAGLNMAGASEPYGYMPYFFSDLFEFGYEAVGEVSSSLNTFADWTSENETGVIYYLRDGTVRGVMLCNVWEKVEDARELIRKKQVIAPQGLRGAIK